MFCYFWKNFFYCAWKWKELAVQGPWNEGNLSTFCDIDMYIHDMYLSSNVTQWNVANCTIFSIPQLPISFVKSSCIKGELKQTAPKLQTYMCDVTS